MGHTGWFANGGAGWFAVGAVEPGERTAVLLSIEIAAMKTDSGFTRIDLLAVVATVSLLALTLAADTRSNAEASVCLNNMRQLSRAQFLYAADHGYFPPNVGGGDSNPSQTWALGFISEFGS